MKSWLRPHVSSHEAYPWVPVVQLGTLPVGDPGGCGCNKAHERERGRELLGCLWYKSKRGLMGGEVKSCRSVLWDDVQLICMFVITNEAKAKGEDVKRCRCCERQRVKSGGWWNLVTVLVHPRTPGGRVLVVFTVFIMDQGKFVWRWDGSGEGVDACNTTRLSCETVRSIGYPIDKKLLSTINKNTNW